MSKNLQSLMGSTPSRRICMLATVAMLALGAFAQTKTLTHVQGMSGRPLAPNKFNIPMQQVHEDWHVVYAVPNTTLSLSRRNDAYTTYARWYDYTTDNAVQGLTCTGTNVGTNVNVSSRGVMRFNPSDDNGLLSSASVSYNSGVMYVACDQSAYKDYVNTSSNFSEPTLSQRLVYEIRPASEMAAKMNAATGENWLEVHKMIAPTGRTLHIGPDYVFQGNGSNYFYGRTPTCANGTLQSRQNANEDGWHWKTNGSFAAPSVSSNQFLTVSNNSAATIVYELTYKAGSTTYNVARFEVTYMDKTEVGPYVDVDDARIRNLEPIAEERFNYTDGHVLSEHNKQYYTKPFDTDESTFGFVYGQANHAFEKPHYTEYALVSTTRKIYDDTEGEGALSNHTFPTDKSNSGFLIYVDGSAIVGRVFSLKVPGMMLCPGATMYFSAFVGDYTVTSYGSHPDLDFIVTGIHTDGSEEIITTFTTGEIDRSSKNNFGIPNNKSNEWLRVLFPIEFTSRSQFREFRLVVTNKSANNYGNDFMLDDIQVFMKPAPLTPIEATSPTTCLTDDDPLVLYTKVDYAKMEKFAGKKLYYRWLNEDMQPIDAPYYNDTTDTQGRPAGYVTLPQTYLQNRLDPANAALVMPSFEAFNTAYSATASSAIAYIYNSATDVIDLGGGRTNNARYSLFIATPIPTLGGRDLQYTCLVSTDLNTLTDKGDCSNSRTIELASGMYIQSDASGEVVKGLNQEACAHYSYDLTFLVKYVVLDGKEGTVAKESRYQAHWLFATEDYVNDNPGLFGADYTTIARAIMHLVISDKLAAAGGNANALSPVEKAEYDHLAAGGSYPAYAGSADERVVELLRQRQLLVLADELADPFKYLVMPLGEADTLHFTAFPILREETDAPDCLTPQSITLYFNGGPDPQRHTVTFVKAYDEPALPEYVSSRPRAVRILEGTTEKEVLVRLSEPQNVYRIMGVELYSIDHSTRALQPLGTDISVSTGMAGNTFTGQAAFTFSLPTTLQPGHQYAYKVTYRLVQNNTQRDGQTVPSCGETDGPDGTSIHDGEAYINFIITPKLLWFDPATISGSWNDDYSFVLNPAERDLHVAPLEGTTVVIAEGSHILLPANTNENQEPGTDRQVDPHAQPYITFDIDYEPYVCHNIHFAPQADLLGQEAVRVGGEWTFDLALQPDRWILSAMPLQGILTGDMYIPAEGEAPVSLDASDRIAIQEMNQTPGTWAADRIVYSMYNSMYNSKVYNTEEDSTVSIGCSSWSPAANALTTVITPGTGWALQMITDEPAPALLRLPKRDTYYGYFRNETWVRDMQARTNRSASYGLPAYRGGDMQIVLSNDSSSVNYLLGNPTFACIDMDLFLEANQDVLTGSYYLSETDSTGSRHITGLSTEGESLTTDPAARHLLEPFRSVFLEARTEGKTLPLTITRSMLTTKEPLPAEGDASQVQKAKKSARSAEAERAIYISARAAGFTSSALLLQRDEARNGVLASEDAEVFLLDAPKTPFAIYTVADDRALAINAMADQAIIPLAFYAQYSIGQEVLSFHGEDAYLQEWDFVDSRTGLRRPLTDGMQLTLSLDPAGSVRYYLEHSRAAEPTTHEDTDPALRDDADLFGYVRDGQLTIYSQDDMLQFRLYDAAGRLIAQQANAGRFQQFCLLHGVYVVRTATAALKVVVK